MGDPKEVQQRLDSNAKLISMVQDMLMCYEVDCVSPETHGIRSEVLHQKQLFSKVIPSSKGHGKTSKSPTFYGERGRDFVTWLYKFECYCNMDILSDRKKCKTAFLCFRDSALTWYDKLETKRRRLGLNNIHSWNELKNCMRNEFVSDLVLNDLKLEIQNVSQGSMCVQDYISHFEELHMLFDDQVTSFEKGMRFYQGLNSQFSGYGDLDFEYFFEEICELAVDTEKQLLKSAICDEHADLLMHDEAMVAIACCSESSKRGDSPCVELISEIDEKLESIEASSVEKNETDFRAGNDMNEFGTSVCFVDLNVDANSKTEVVMMNDVVYESEQMELEIDGKNSECMHLDSDSLEVEDSTLFSFGLIEHEFSTKEKSVESFEMEVIALDLDVQFRGIIDVQSDFIYKDPSCSCFSWLALKNHLELDDFRLSCVVPACNDSFLAQQKILSFGLTISAERQSDSFSIEFQNSRGVPTVVSPYFPHKRLTLGKGNTMSEKTIPDLRIWVPQVEKFHSNYFHIFWETHNEREPYFNSIGVSAILISCAGMNAKRATVCSSIPQDFAHKNLNSFQTDRQGYLLLAMGEFIEDDELKDANVYSKTQGACFASWFSYLKPSLMLQNYNNWEIVLGGIIRPPEFHGFKRENCVQRNATSYVLQLKNEELSLVFFKKVGHGSNRGNGVCSLFYKDPHEYYMKQNANLVSISALAAVFYGKSLELHKMNITWFDDILWVHDPGTQRSDFIVYSRLTFCYESFLEVSGASQLFGLLFEAAKISEVNCAPSADLEGEQPDFEVLLKVDADPRTFLGARLFEVYRIKVYTGADRGRSPCLRTSNLRTNFFQEGENELETPRVNFQFRKFLSLVDDQVFIWLVPWYVMMREQSKSCHLAYMV